MSSSTIVSLFGSSNEVWKTIPETDGLYSASSFGRIRSEPISYRISGRQRGRILSPAKDTKGYRWFRVCIPSKNNSAVKVHRAVASAFIGSCPEGMQVNHKDGDKENNRPWNLEYISCRENIRHCWANGLHGVEHCQGSNNFHSRLSKEDVLDIRRLHPSKSLKNLAEKFGVTKQAIWHIIHKKTWKHI